jgi:RecG-like helicase
MRGGRIYTITFVDPIGNKGQITIFNSGFLASKINEDKRYIIVGKPAIKLGKITFSHPDVVETEAPEDPDVALEDKVEIKENYNTGRIFPIYPELMGIKPGWFAQKMRLLIDKIDTIFSEYLPQEFIEKF